MGAGGTNSTELSSLRDWIGCISTYEEEINTRKYEWKRVKKFSFRHVLFEVIAVYPKVKVKYKLETESAEGKLSWREIDIWKLAVYALSLLPCKLLK